MQSTVNFVGHTGQPQPIYRNLLESRIDVDVQIFAPQPAHGPGPAGKSEEWRAAAVQLGLRA